MVAPEVVAVIGGGVEVIVEVWVMIGPEVVDVTGDGVEVIIWV